MINVLTKGRPALWRICWVVLIFCLEFDVAAQTCLQWVPRTDVGTPGRRYGHAMAYDPDRGVTVFFGGAFSEIGGEEIGFSDTWEYDGVQWRQITVNGTVPPFRANHAMCYNNGYILMGGGRIAGNARASDWWAYFGAGDGTGT